MSERLNMVDLYDLTCVRNQVEENTKTLTNRIYILENKLIHSINKTKQRLDDIETKYDQMIKNMSDTILKQKEIIHCIARRIPFNGENWQYELVKEDLANYIEPDTNFRYSETDNMSMSSHNATDDEELICEALTDVKIKSKM